MDFILVNSSSNRIRSSLIESICFCTMEKFFNNSAAAICDIEFEL